ncbi:hypothetical protein ACGFY9_13970 [Streptomyces sp. NPDC048504]|uniref:hypothetical protein n=1 Tax=Streptomyces sp. NPDC048504 TaxID=3365559 RepID=UPI00371725CA
MSAPSTVQWLRTAVHRVAVGSQRLSLHLTSRALHRARAVWDRARGWLTAGEGLGRLLRAAVLVGAAVLLRKIGTAVAVGVYHRVEHGGAPWLLWGGAACWAIAAYRAGAEGWAPKRRPAPEPDDPQEDAAPETGPETPAPTVWPVSPIELIAAVRDIGTPHAQLKPLAEHLRTTTDAVRAAAAGMGWRVKDVRMDGRSSSAGLHWDECPSPEQVYPLSGDVGAGQPADDNDDDTSGEGVREGLDVRRTATGQTMYDLAEQHRITAVLRPKR